MRDPELVLKHKDDVRYRIVGEEAVVVRQDAAEVLALNDVGARVLELLDAHNTLADVVETMRREYDVSSEELERDVESFVMAMQDAGIVEEVDSKP